MLRNESCLWSMFEGNSGKGDEDASCVICHLATSLPFFLAPVLLLLQPHWPLPIPGACWAHPLPGAFAVADPTPMIVMFFTHTDSQPLLTAHWGLGINVPTSKRPSFITLYEITTSLYPNLHNIYYLLLSQWFCLIYNPYLPRRKQALWRGYLTYVVHCSVHSNWKRT